MQTRYGEIFVSVDFNYLFIHISIWKTRSLQCIIIHTYQFKETKLRPLAKEEASTGFEKYFDIYRCYDDYMWSSKFFTLKKRGRRRRREGKGFGLHRTDGALKRYTTRINIARLKMCRQEHVRTILDSSRRNCEERQMGEGGGKRDTFYTPACPLCGYSDYIVGLGFIVRPAPPGIVALFRGPEIHTFSQARFSTMGAFH